jgi:hypothetical protein
MAFQGASDGLNADLQFLTRLLLVYDPGVGPPLIRGILFVRKPAAPEAFVVAPRRRLGGDALAWESRLAPVTRAWLALEARGPLYELDWLAA